MTQPRTTLHGRRLVTAGSVGIALVGVAAVLFGLTGKRPPALDTAWYELLAAHRVPALESIALVLNYVGGTLSMSIISIALVAVLLLLRRVTAAIVVGVSVALATIISTVIKLLLGRPRPPQALADVETSSFPSGHTTAAAALTIALALLVSRAWVWVLAVAWIIAMAFSRTYLLVHWATDVTAGAVLGASVALVVYAVAQRLTDTRRRVILE